MRETVMRAVLRRIAEICCIGGVLACTAMLNWFFIMISLSGDVLHDRSGNGPNARIHGAQWVVTERGGLLP